MIYFNNSATSYPKPKEVLDKVNQSLLEPLILGRSNNVNFFEYDIFLLRKNISSLINAKNDHNIIFSSNSTTALNTLIFSSFDSILKEGDSILTSSLEHNSVYFILKELEKRGINIIYTPYENNELDYSFIKKQLNDNRDIKLTVFTHASNVLGDVINLDLIGEILKTKNIPFFVDASQTIGCYPINVEKSFIDGLVFTGHKSLMGIQGVGGFYIRNNIKLKATVWGSNGNSFNENDEIVLPDNFEVGTPNLLALLALNESVKFIIKTDINKIYKEDKIKAQYLYDSLSVLPEVILYGSSNKEIPIISFNIKNKSALHIGELLSQQGIVCRAGLHCSDLTHKSLKTTDLGGTVRISLGFFNTMQEIEYFIKTLKDITKERLGINKNE